MMNLQDQDQKDLQPIDEFSTGITELKYNPPKDYVTAPEQADVTLAPESVFEGGESEDEKAPLVGEVDEVKEPKPEVKEPKPEAKESKPEAKKPEPKEEKIDFVKTMRDNDLEIFTKEMFTNDVSDEDFANQLINDKFLGQQSYVKEIDYNTFEYYPKPIADKVEELKVEVGRSVATLAPKERAILAKGKGSDELVYNKYLKMLNDNQSSVVAASLAVGAGAAITSKSIVGGFIAGAATAYGLIYTGAQLADADARAVRRTPEELKAMKETNLNREGIESVLSLGEQVGLSPKVREYITQITERDIDDEPYEAYVKELTPIALEALLFAGVGKVLTTGVKASAAGAKAGKNLISKADNALDEGPELNEMMDKLSELLEVQKTIKSENKRLKAAKQSFADIEDAYSHVPPPVPTAKNATVDFNAMAGEALDKYMASGGKDKIAFEDFRINNVRGSNYKLNTKLTSELPKDVAEAQVKAKKTSQTFGKGDEGGGTTIMVFANKFDELGLMRKKAIKNGDLELDLHLNTLQDDIENRISIELTQSATKMQEINRSMPMRRHMKTLQNERAYNASLLKQQGLTAKARKRLDAKQAKLEKEITRNEIMMKEATSAELVTMGIANSIYTNMLGGAATAKAALGGLLSTTNNMVLLASKGVHPAQIAKMQINAAKRLKNDFHKFDVRQFRSDVVSGTINSRFKAKNVADLTINESDSVTRKGLKYVNKGINVAASPVQIGLGMVDFVMDRFNRQTRATEFWYDYVKNQKAMGRTGDELVEELQSIINNPELLENKPDFYKQVMQAAEEGLATDKMMLTKPHSKDYYFSKPAWMVDKLFNSNVNVNFVNTGLKFINPFTRTAASMLDSVAENSAIGMFRTLAPNEKFASLTTRQLQGTIASMGAAYALHDQIKVVPKGAERTAGAFGFRSGVEIGGHQFPMSTLGIYGDIIERFSILTDTLEAAQMDGTDTSGTLQMMGGLLEVLTVTGAVENVHQFTQDILNISQGKSRVEVTKLIETFAPAGYAIKGIADLDQGSLAANPYLMEVFGQMDTEFGNAKRKDAFGTNISEGEITEISRGLSWLVDRKGEDGAGIKLNKMFLDAGVYQSGALAAFRTKDGLVPHRTIMVDGNYTPLTLQMTPLTGSVKVGGSPMFNVSLATKHKALGVMSLDKEKMLNTLNSELTNLAYIETTSEEGKILKESAIRNLRSIRENVQVSLNKLAQYGMNKTLPKALAEMMERDVPNITKNFDEKNYAVRDLMRFNRGMFNGDLKKQKEFFTRVNRVKNAVLYYNSIKTIGKQFMQNSAEAISAEIKRIEEIKAAK